MMDMRQHPRLSESLAAVRDSMFDVASKGGAVLTADQARAIGRFLDQMVDRAGTLERAERQLAEASAPGEPAANVLRFRPRCAPSGSGLPGNDLPGGAA